MKKLLLFISIIGTFIGASAQVLDSDNFNTLTVGNIGTDITGVTPGQGLWQTSVSGGANTDFQIIDNGAPHGNVLQLTGSSTATGTRFMWKDGFSDVWGFRDAGNDILQVEYDFFTGPATTSKNTQRIMIFNTDRTKFLGGLIFAEDTKIISGLSYYNNAGTLGNFSFNPTSGAVVLAANTWVRMGFSFNLTTGQVLCKAPGLNIAIPGAAMGEAPNEIDFIVSAGTANTVATIGLFDNYTVSASATDTLLAVNQVITPTNFSVAPNPASNVVNIYNNENFEITSVTMTDLNGRVVKQSEFDNVTDVQINIADLSTGIYMMKITSNQGTTIKKIIKN